MMEQAVIGPSASRFPVPALIRSCAECRDLFNQAVISGAGIISVRIDDRAGELLVEFDASETSASEVERTVAGAWEEVRSKYVRETLQIKGMHCNDCARSLQGGVRQLGGVEDALVNFAGGTMSVAYDEHVVDLDAISRRVGEFGYEVEHNQEEADAPEESRGAVVGFVRSPQTRLTLASSVLTIVGGGLYLTAAPAIWSTLLFMAAIVLAGIPLSRKALLNLRVNRHLDINALMTIAVIGAAAIGEWFEAATVVVLFSLGEALEGFSMDRARRSIRSLMGLTPKHAFVVRDGREISISVRDIVSGDVLIVRPGDKIPVDGVVDLGSSAVNQAPVTGESVSVEKEPGDDVYAGTINGASGLRIRATRAAKDSTIARIIHMVEEAQSQKAPTQRFIDVFARYYTPAVVAAAALIAVIPPLFLGGWLDWLYRALVLLVIACPCALVISTPVTIVSGISAAARNGVLVKGGAYLEALGKLRALAFDKTGTLTRGEPSVVAVTPLEEGVGEDTILGLAAAAERYSEHPIGAAIVRAAEQRGANDLIVNAPDVKVRSGRGIEAVVEGKHVRVGSRRFVFDGHPDDTIEAKIVRQEQAGNTTVIVAVDSVPLGLIAVADELRPEAAGAVQSLREAGVDDIAMLTGDRKDVADVIARQVGIHEVHAELLPHEKVDAVAAMLERHSAVAMVGDGINDAPALARATVGIAMGAAGTETALETADVALMGDDLERVGYAIRLSRRTRDIIIQNIILALGIKVVIFALAVAGEATLWQAIFADVGASLIVILNGMRLLRKGGTRI